jgi:hypothetical protein
VRPVIWLLLLMGPSGPVLALQATFGLEYEDNPLASGGEKQGAWVNRFYISSSGNLIERAWGQVGLRQQWGIKSFREDGAGEVVASRLELQGTAFPHPLLGVAWGAELKLKDVNRVLSEDGYRRDVQYLNFQGELGEGFSAGLRLRRSGDTVSDAGLADLKQVGVGSDFGYARGRGLRLRLGFDWNQLEYARSALEQGFNQQPAPGRRQQSDRLFHYSVGLQLYRGMLVDMQFGWLHNRSNSLGYGYRAHRWQASLTRSLPWKTDGQVFVAGQRRRYGEQYARPLPGNSSERDEYAQTLMSVKAQRQLGHHYGLSLHYRHARNGSRQGEGAYRKNTYGMALEVAW